jgi:hypothetical protein
MGQNSTGEMAVLRAGIYCHEGKIKTGWRGETGSLKKLFNPVHPVHPV